MISASVKTENLYLKEPRLEMLLISRFLSRLIIYSLYAIIFTATITFLLSDINWLFWSGVLLLLFLIDRFLHFGEARKSLFALGNVTGRRINVADYLSPRSLSIIEKALDQALIYSTDIYLNLAKILIDENELSEVLRRIEIAPEDFESKIDFFLKKNESGGKIKRRDLIIRLEGFLKNCFLLALSFGEKFIEPRVLFAGLGSVDSPLLIRLWEIFAVKPFDLENILIFARFHKKFGSLTRLPMSLGGFVKNISHIRHRFMNRAWSARPTPALDRHSLELTDLARKEKIGFLIGHQKEYEQMVDILSRPVKPNVLLMGEPGSGKDTLVGHLAFQIVNDRVPEPLFDKRLVALEIGSLVSGAGPDEVSARINLVVDEILKAGNIILYIPDIHNLIKTSGEYLSAADVLIPVITSDAFPLIGSTYPREYKQMIESRSDFASAFEVVNIEEISEADAIKLLSYLSIILEEEHRIAITFGAVKQAVELAHKYFRQKLLPASAEELLRETITYALQRGEKSIVADDVVAVAERRINIPIHRAGKEEAEKLLNLEEIIHKRLIDQDEAVKAVSDALRQYRSGLARSKGPIAVFLFVGPTGVGKTELAKVLTAAQFGSEKLMVRFDMSEYQEKQSIYRFIGSPDAKMSGNLTESILQKPYSLVLLDEFEKAHPDILNLFLQVFDDGRLTDNLGRTIDFTHTIIIATSNAHSDFIKNHLEAHTPIAVIAEQLKKKLTAYFRPELLNRFSDIIVFKPLSVEDVHRIAKIQLKDLANILRETNGVDLIFEESAVKKIAELGFDPVFGGRPLRGVISDKIKSVLAEKILKGEIARGASVRVSLKNEGEFEFKAS